MQVRLNSCVVIATACLLTGSLTWIPREPVSAQTVVPTRPIPPGPFRFFLEYHGSQGYRQPQATMNFLDGMSNAISLWPPVADGLTVWAGRTENLMLLMAGSAALQELPAAEIARQATAFTQLSATAPGANLFWSLMPEWDQSGGHWVPRGRPRYTNLTRQEAYRRFLAYYEQVHPDLIAQLRRPPGPNSPWLTALSVYVPNVAYAYELGAEWQMLERGLDELGDLPTGIAFMRGAGHQYGKPWGIDISNWRTSTNSATAYDSNGRLLGGWSASYIERLYYLSYAAGSNFIHNEAATYRRDDGTLNPLGLATKRFADFALRRHPDVGTPSVPLALLMDHLSGFDTKHGPYNQANAVWYQDIPYSNGDHMTDNFLRVAYPGHWLHGLTPGAPFADSKGIPATPAFQRYLAEGNDPRPYEPMPTTRWGDNLDVLTTHVTQEALRSYRVLFLLGDVALDARLRGVITNWVAEGGVLVVNAAQAAGFDEKLLGVQILPEPPRRAAQAIWTDGGTVEESAFAYAVVRPVSATVMAHTVAKDALITKHLWGRGEVILTAPLYLQAENRSRLLEVGTQLVDRLVRRFEPVQVQGPPVEYVIGRSKGKVVVTLANSTGAPWQGRVIVPKPPASSYQVSEYLSDQPLVPVVSATELAVPVSVPAYSVRVVGVEWAMRESGSLPGAGSGKGRRN